MTEMHTHEIENITFSIIRGLNKLNNVDDPISRVLAQEGLTEIVDFIKDNTDLLHVNKDK